MSIGRRLPSSWIAIQAVIALIFTSGCASGGRQYPTAKWAMDDGQYAEEHSAPYSSDRQERRAQKAWDMADASFQAGKSGVYVGGGGSTRHNWPATVGSMGVFRLPTSWSTFRYGVFGMDNGGIGVGGAEVGFRIHAPTRLTPYVGLSSDLGFSSMHSSIASQNTRYARKGQRISRPTGLLAIVPEAGLSYWVTSSSRLNAGASYYVTDGRPDFLLFGVSMEFLSREDTTSTSDAPWQSGTTFPPITDSNDFDSPFAENAGPYFKEMNDETDPVNVAFAGDDERADGSSISPATFANSGQALSEPPPFPGDLPALLLSLSDVFRDDLRSSVGPPESLSSAETPNIIALP